MVNDAYFSGRMDLVPDGQEILANWQKSCPADFFTVYLLSILQEEPANMNIAQGTL